MTDPSSHRVEDVYGAMVIELTGKEPKGRLPRTIAQTGLTSKRLRKRLGVEEETLDYLTWNADFDTTIAEQLLEGSGIQCADFVHSIPSITAFYNENKSNSDYHILIE